MNASARRITTLVPAHLLPRRRPNRRELGLLAALLCSGSLLGYDRMQMQHSRAEKLQASQQLETAQTRQQAQQAAEARQRQAQAFFQRLQQQGAFAEDSTPPSPRHFPGETLALDWQPVEEQRAGPHTLRRQRGQWLFTARHEVAALERLAQVQQAWPERLRWLELGLRRSENGLLVRVDMEWRSSPGPTP